jgi:DNA-binding MarR family transcriptional regulator
MSTGCHVRGCRVNITSVDPLSRDELRLWHAWKRASETVRARIADAITAATGLSDPDFGVLTRLDDAPRGTLRQNELATSLGWHRSRLSHQLTRMAARGLVTRAPAGDGTEATITPAGRAAITAARPHHAAAVRRHLISGLPPDGLDEVTAILERLARRDAGPPREPPT